MGDKDAWSHVVFMEKAFGFGKMGWHRDDEELTYRSTRQLTTGLPRRKLVVVWHLGRHSVQR